MPGARLGHDAASCATQVRGHRGFGSADAETRAAPRWPNTGPSLRHLVCRADQACNPRLADQANLLLTRYAPDAGTAIAGGSRTLLRTTPLCERPQRPGGRAHRRRGGSRNGGAPAGRACGNAPPLTVAPVPMRVKTAHQGTLRRKTAGILLCKRLTGCTLPNWVKSSCQMRSLSSFTSAGPPLSVDGSRVARGSRRQLLRHRPRRHRLKSAAGHWRATPSMLDSAVVRSSSRRS